MRLATNSSGSSSEDILFYFKMLTMIVETCNLEIKDVDPSMKSKLINILPTKSTCFSTCQSESNLLTNNNDNSKNINIKQKQKTKHLHSPGPKNVKTPNTNNPKKKNGSKKKNVQTKTQMTNANDINQLKSKMVLELINSSPAEENRCSNNSNPFTTESLRNEQTNKELHNYTQQLYLNILNNTQQQYNLHNITSHGLNRYFNQNYANLNSSSHQSPFQNPQTPLLSLRPQISPEMPKPTKQHPKKMPTKKK